MGLLLKYGLGTDRLLIKITIHSQDSAFLYRADNREEFAGSSPSDGQQTPFSSSLLPLSLSRADILASMPDGSNSAAVSHVCVPVQPRGNDCAMQFQFKAL